MKLPVRYDGRSIGLIEAERDRVTLTYDPTWLTAPDRFPISLTMPLGEAAFDSDVVLPWIMNLLPEGEPLRAMTRMLGAAPEDVLGLILETGSDLAGALSIGEGDSNGSPRYRPIGGPDALERVIQELPARPFLAGDEGVSMSLAGAQDKLPVALNSAGEITIPLGGAASTHILKPDNPRLFGSVQNEALCMVLARRIGLNTAAVTTGTAGARSYLLVTRYDRALEGDRVRRLHQEDFAQALGRPPSAKYEFNRTGRRGPSLAEMFALTRRHMTAVEITRLLDAVIFNVATGNVDSHAKNYSLLLQPQGPTLAPLYDLMTGLAWDGITPNHAQEVGGQRRGRYIYGRHWERLANACGLAPRATVRRVEALITRLLRELPAATEEVAAMPAGTGAFLKVFQGAIAERAVEVRAHALVAGDAAPDEAPAVAAPDPADQGTAYPS